MDFSHLSEPNIRQQKTGLTPAQYDLYSHLGDHVSAIATHHKLSITHIKRFGDGRISATLDVTTSERRFVLKISAKDDLIADTFFLKKARTHGIPVPTVYLSDTTRTVIPFEYLFLEYINGVNANDAPLPLQLKAAQEFGRQLARLHTRPSGGFGVIDAHDHFSANNWCTLLISSLRRTWQQTDPKATTFTQVDQMAIEELLRACEDMCNNFRPRLLHGDAGGDNVLVLADHGGAFKGIAIIDPGTWIGGDPMQDLAFSQMSWHYQGFSEGVMQGYTKEQRLASEERERLEILRIFNQYWGAMISEQRGWGRWRDEMLADARASLAVYKKNNRL